MSGEYVYLATSDEDGEPMCGFTRKYELQRWCRFQERDGYPNGGWLSLYGITTSLYGNVTRIREYEYRDGQLIDKAP